MKKAKIVATLGPASESREMMIKLIRAGVNVFRINFSHSSHDKAKELIDRIRGINEELGCYVAILADLQGPKIRVGNVAADALLKSGDEFILEVGEFEGNASRASINYIDFAADVKPGERILLDDGKLVLEVEATDGDKQVRTRVVQGGPLRSKKGVNLPNTQVSLPCLTEKDERDLEFALEMEVDWIALSFVRRASDITEIKSKIKAAKAWSKVIAKIEKPSAVTDIESIVEESDAIMVARGDLGVEIPMQRVPLIQKMICELGRKHAKPVIIATQMMESMLNQITPTRAEVNDVANSVLDGADAVMLSGETSVGEYPLEVVENMAKIIMHIEESGEIRREANPPKNPNDVRYVSDSICYNSSRMAEQVQATAILTMTHSGYTAFRISSHRPNAQVFAFTSNRKIMSTLSLVWGVSSFYYDSFESTDETFRDIKKIIHNKRLVEKGDLIIKIASMPMNERGMSNMMKIGEIK
jgi:pyruvate kinase